MTSELTDNTTAELCIVCGQYGIYDDLRYRDYPGLHRYEGREGDECYLAVIEKSVMVNFSGTLFFKEPLPEDKAIYWKDSKRPVWDGFDDESCNRLLGVSITAGQFLEMSDKEINEYVRRYS